MMTSADRVRLQRDWLAAVEAEIDRRKMARAAEDDAVVEKLLASLDVMGQRLRADPGYVEPSATERAAIKAAFEEAMRRTHG